MLYPFFHLVIFVSSFADEDSNKEEVESIYLNKYYMQEEDIVKDEEVIDSSLKTGKDFIKESALTQWS